MRLIDADVLKTEINFSVTIIGKDNAVEVKRLMEQYNKAIDNAPTIDAEPIVRCKNCKHYIPSKEMPHRGWCDDALQNVFKEDFYCGFGKRR